MIRLTRINHTPLVLNSDLIEHVEVTPDTVISLTNGRKFVVLEPPEEVIERVVEFRRAINEHWYKRGTYPRTEPDKEEENETEPMNDRD